MKKIFSKATLFSAVALASVPAAFAQEASVDVAEAAGDFLGTFTTAASVVGGVLISAAFIAIVWKWIKGMVFN